MHEWSLLNSEDEKLSYIKDKIQIILDKHNNQKS